jgi:type IX secretion system PorP/SprF family membrane protein
MKITKLLKYLTIAAAMTATLPAAAQIDAQFTQYWSVPSYYNPGAAGSTDYIHVTGGSRLQWVGIPKAPQHFLALGDMPFKFSGKKFGVGAMILQESMGLYNSINAGAQLAYKRKMLKGEMSLGVQVGLINQTFKGSKVDISGSDDYHKDTDEGIPTTDITGSALDVGAGLMFTGKNFWVSVSGKHLTQSSITLKSDNDADKLYEFKVGRTYYFMAGGNIPIKNTLFELQPSVMAKTDMTFFQGEATARVRWRKFLSFGAGYRWKDAVSVTVGAEYKGFYFGYSYDYPLSEISKVSNGSHEVFVSYNIKLDLGDKNKNKHKSIRIM